jgi:arylformamidase
MTLYKHYDREALDKQYDNRAAVPEFPRFVEQWERQSEQLRRKAELIRDVPYGDHERERLDIFPSAVAGSPIQVFFHGGYWQAMDKQVFHFMADGFVEKGVTTALVNYPLAPHVTMDDLVNACRRAMAWLFEHAGAYNGDPDQLFISGHSAGGHIVAMLMATRWEDFSRGLPAEVIRGGCALSGLFDLIPIHLCYLNDVLGMDQQMAERNSPVRLSPTCFGSLIVGVGGLESDEYHAQSRDFSEAWSQKGSDIQSMTLPNHHHFSILDELTDENSPLYRAMLDQMGVSA